MNKEDQLKNKANFTNENGDLYLVRCESCGNENYAPMVATGQCAWCGWKEEKED